MVLVYLFGISVGVLLDMNRLFSVNSVVGLLMASVKAS